MASTQNKLAKTFSLVLGTNLNCSKINGRNSRTQVATSKSVVFSPWTAFAWPFAIRCDNTRIKHATLLAKLLYILDITTRGPAWMKCKGSAFLQRNSNSDETFLRGLFAWSNAEPNRNLLLRHDHSQAHRATECCATTQYFVQHSGHCG